MEWGTRTAIDTYRKLHNRVPYVVYDLGAVGKEPMVRLLAHRAVDAAGLGAKIGRKLREEYQGAQEGVSPFEGMV